MPKILRTQIFPTTTQIKDVATRAFAEKLIHFLDEIFRKVSSIPFNQSESLSVADTGVANTEFTVTHHLKRTPTGFIITRMDKACAVYDSGKVWTSDVIYLKCNVANVAIGVFIF